MFPQIVVYSRRLIILAAYLRRRGTKTPPNRSSIRHLHSPNSGTWVLVWSSNWMRQKLYAEPREPRVPEIQQNLNSSMWYECGFSNLKVPLNFFYLNMLKKRTTEIIYFSSRAKRKIYSVITERARKNAFLNYNSCCSGTRGTEKAVNWIMIDSYRHKICPVALTWWEKTLPFHGM